jgi:hypothetical protein
VAAGRLDPDADAVSDVARLKSLRLWN